MANDNKLKPKERQKSKNAKKKQPSAIPRIIEKSLPKKNKPRKISEKYLKEELQVENSLKEHLKNQPFDEEFEKQKQAEIDFFCNPYSSVPLNIEKTKSTDNDTTERDEEEEEIEAHSTHSNESSPNTHMASTYIGHEHESIVAKFELTRISYDELKISFYPNADRSLKGKKYISCFFSLITF